MNIIYVTEIPFSSKYALPTHVKEIVNNLSELNNKVILIGQRSQNFSKEKNVKYLLVPRIKLLREVSFNLQLLFLLPFFIKKNKIEAIYTRQGLSLISPAIISRIFSIPYITEVNGVYEEEMRAMNHSEIFIKISLFVEKFCYSSAKNIITVTNSIKKYLISKYNLDKNKLHVLENGVDINLFAPKKLPKKYDLLFVGSFTFWQGLEYLISSLPIVVKEKKDMKLAIIGDGKEKENLIKLSRKLGLDKNIFFLGTKDHKKIPSYINKSNICIAPFELNDRNKKWYICI